MFTDLDLTPAAPGRGSSPRPTDLRGPGPGPRMPDPQVPGGPVPLHGPLGPAELGPVGPRVYDPVGPRPFHRGPRHGVEVPYGPDMAMGAGPGMMHGRVQGAGMMDPLAEMPLTSNQQGETVSEHHDLIQTWVGNNPLPCR